ncbi:MAG: MBL fold metallo-hydrolase [Anaerolineae bacterium]|nr:MBL fold metallo-hydrolase [Anaerolineae bacterium]
MTEFTTQIVADGVWYIEDSRGGVMYLIAGQERALLIDTGWGEGDLPGLVATLTPLPLWVVNTHGHRDHTSGNEQFAQVYIHTNDIPLAQDSGTRLVAVYDGYHFDLGGRDVQVIGVPGHSPGSICLLDRQARILFSGDSPRPGPVWLHLDTSLTVREFANSLSRLRAFAAEFDVIAPSHGKPAPAGTLLDDLIACTRKTLSGELAGQPNESRFGPCLLAEWNGAGIMYKADKVQFTWMPRRGIVSPEVHADRTVTFRVSAPQAKSVLLNSTPLMNALGSADGSIAFDGKDDAGLWSLTVGPLPPDIYDYGFVIDGVSLIDSNNPGVQTGTMSPRSLFTVPVLTGVSLGGEPGYYEARNVPHGTLHRHYYASRTLGDVRDVYVYTPPGYEANPDQTYPVLYLLHGGGDDASGWTAVGRAHLIVDNLLAEGKARPMIVVMPFGQAISRMASWEDLQKNTPLFEQDLLTDVMPLVESAYRIRADREHRAMAGLSMGGGQTDHIGLGHLDLFSAIGILSAGRGDFAGRHPDLVADPEATNRKLDLFFLGCGTLDPLATEGMGQMHALLEEKGIRHVYWTMDGAAHTWVVWRYALYHEFLPRLWR